MKYCLKSNRSFKNRRVLKTLCFFLFLSPFIQATEIKDTIIYTGELSIDPLSRISMSENDFSFLTTRSWNLEKRKLTIHQLDLKTHSLTDLIVKIPTNLKILQIPAFALTDSFLLLQDDYNLKWFLFKLAGGEFKIVEEIILPHGTMAFNASAVSTAQFLFTDIYNHHPLDSVYNTSLTIYNARERKFQNIIHPEVPCIGLSHFPQHWISFNQNTIALAEPCGNEMRLYDMELKFLKKISLPKKEKWINLPGNKIPVETSPQRINPKEFITEFESSLSTFSRIESIYFANDSILLISTKQPDKTGSVTKNFVYNILSEKFTDPNNIGIQSSGLHSDCREDLTFHLDPYLSLQNGIYISLEEDNYISDTTLSKEENEIRKNIFYENNDPEFIIRLSAIYFNK